MNDAAEAAALPPRLAAARTLFAGRRFRTYWLASATFALGIWAYITTLGWAARSLTDDAWRLSLTNVVYFSPMFVLALPMGVVADRWDRRRIAIAVRLTTAGSTVLLTLAAASGRLTYPMLLGFAFLVGVSVVAELPARQAYIAQIVPAEQLMHAAALTDVQGGFARFLGPIAAGALIHRFGPEGGFGMFAVADLVFVSLYFFRMRPPEPAEPAGPAPAGSAPGAGRPLAELAEGFRYLRAHRDARSIVSISIGAGAVGWVYLALLPAMARDVLHGDAVTYGALGMAVGLGSIPFSLALALRRGTTAQERLYVATTLLWGVGIVGFSLSRWFPLSFAALAVAGLGYGGQAILARAILLRIVDVRYHGRVLGTLMLTFGANVAGTLVAGALARTLGVPLVIGLSGAGIVAVVAAALARNPALLSRRRG